MLTLYEVWFYLLKLSNIRHHTLISSWFSHADELSLRLVHNAVHWGLISVSFLCATVLQNILKRCVLIANDEIMMHSVSLYKGLKIMKIVWTEVTTSIIHAHLQWRIICREGWEGWESHNWVSRGCWVLRLSRTHWFCRLIHTNFSPCQCCLFKSVWSIIMYLSDQSVSLCDAQD